MTSLLTIETSRFFMIMERLAAAKVERDAEAIIEWIDELGAIAMHGAPGLAKRAAAEVERASALLSDIQSQRFGYTGPAVVAIRAAEPANLN